MLYKLIIEFDGKVDNLLEKIHFLDKVGNFNSDLKIIWNTIIPNFYLYNKYTKIILEKIILVNTSIKDDTVLNIAASEKNNYLINSFYIKILVYILIFVIILFIIIVIYCYFINYNVYDVFYGSVF